MSLFLNALLQGARVLLAGSRPPSPASGGPTFKWHAVPPRLLAEFLEDHPDAVDAADLIPAMAARGSVYLDSARSYYVRFARQHLGQLVYVEVE